MGPDQPLLTKCLVPMVSRPLVERPRLNIQLEAGLQRKLTLISAPAGFGKSTLVAAWAQDKNAVLQSTVQGADGSPSALPPRVNWVSLEVTDNTPAQFWLYVFTALDQDVPERPRVALPALEASQREPFESVLTAFINARLTRPAHSVLVLDDYHVITDQEIHRSLGFLLDHLPPQLHVMLLSRSEPPLPLARLRAQRQINEIGSEHLRCTLPETAAFMHEVMGVELGEDTTRQMLLRTEGWLVGLQLLGLSLQGRRDAAALLEELGGSQRHVFDYLMDEVLRQQPEDWQQFLLRSSILERLSAPLCDAVLERHDARALLDELERANLFVVALDENRRWFRYHHLFREALQARLEALEPGLVGMLHQRASDWFSVNGDLVGMSSHVIQAELWSRADVLSESDRQTRMVQGLTARALMIALESKTDHARELIRVALGLLPQESLLERAAALHVESTAAAVDGRFIGAYQSAMQAVGLLRQAGHVAQAVNLCATASIYVHRQGRLDETESLLEHTLEQAIQTDNSAAASVIYGYQALLLLERNRLDTALDLVTRAVQLAKQAQANWALAFVYTYLAWIYLARQAYAQAQAALAQAVQSLPENDPPHRLATMITPLQVRLWLAQDELERAQVWAERLRFEPGTYSLFAQELLEVARSRVMLASGRPQEALRVLPGLIAGASELGRWVHVLEMWLLQAVAYHLSGDEPAALDVLARAVAFGETQGYVRRFLDEGPVMAALLLKLRERTPEPRIAVYLDQLLTAFRSSEATRVATGPAPTATNIPLTPTGSTDLSRREMEVLAFLARGLSNDDIARQMNVSQHTVKSHVGSVLSKLEANNRTHAVARARALGLLEPGV